MTNLFSSQNHQNLHCCQSMLPIVFYFSFSLIAVATNPTRPHVSPALTVLPSASINLASAIAMLKDRSNTFLFSFLVSSRVWYRVCTFGTVVLIAGSEVKRSILGFESSWWISSFLSLLYGLVHSFY